MTIKSYTLANGVEIPALGYGTYKVEDGNQAVESVKTALATGYRHIDTASFYGNEESIGEAVRQSGIPRNEVFVVSKVWNTEQGYEKTINSFETSLKKMKFDYLDLFLVHWPKEISGETWRALEKLYREGKIRAIGVSNFMVHHLENLLKTAEIMPMVNQIEFHPQLMQKGVLDYCKEKNIIVEAWAPLMRGRIFDIPLLKELSEKYNRTISQIVLRWDLQMGVVTLPKTVNPNRIAENMNIFDFELSQEDMQKICDLNTEERIGADPDKIDF